MPSPDPQAGLEPDYRFTLANERTFLAYERTAIGLVAASVAVLNLLEPEWPEQLLGGLLLVAGAVASIGGWFRFKVVDGAIRAGQPLPANPVAHLLAATIFCCLVVAAVAVIL